MNQWAETYPQVINASSPLNGLAQELNLMSQLQLMISMDSGNMHLASLVNTPVIRSWGATSSLCRLYRMEPGMMPTPCKYHFLADLAASMAISLAYEAIMLA